MNHFLGHQNVFMESKTTVPSGTLHLVKPPPFLAPFLAQLKKENTYLQTSNKSLEVAGKARGAGQGGQFLFKR